MIGKPDRNFAAFGRNSTMNVPRLTLIGLAAAFLAQLWAPFATAKPASWLQIGYNSGHTGFNNNEATINSKNVGTLANIGTFTTNGVPYQPLISNGMIFVRSNDNDQTIYAWNLATGKLVWSIPLATIDGPNELAIGGEILLAHCGFHVGNGICAYRTTTGKSLWSYGLPNGGGFTPTTIVGDTVYYGQSGQNGSDNGYNMVALDLKTGTPRWIFGPCPNGLCGGMGGSAPAVDSGMVYFGCTGGGGDEITKTGVCALNASTGALVWQSVRLHARCDSAERSNRDAALGHRPDRST
jgi:hypothetical protein